MKGKNYRTLIISVAEEIINQQGIKNLTVANIVQQCRISNRNFYESYSSKKELLDEIKRLCRLEGCEIPDERQLILEKAEEGISFYGFNNITLDSVAKSAGINRGAIYKHFSDKYELLECCIEFQFAKIKHVMTMVYEANINDPENYLRKFVENFAYFLSHTQDSSIITETWSHMNYRPRVRELTVDIQEHFRELIRQSLSTGINQGRYKPDLDMLAVSNFISMTINGMAYYINKDINSEKFSKQSVDLMLEAIFSIIRK